MICTGRRATPPLVAVGSWDGVAEPATRDVREALPVATFWLVARIDTTETKLALWRALRGLSQEELSARSGVSVRAIRRLESSDAGPPRLVALVNLAIALSVPLPEIVEDRWLAWSPMKNRKTPPPPLPNWENLRQVVLAAERQWKKAEPPSGLPQDYDY